MEIAPFETEHFYAKYEFNTPYQLCNSDCESMPINELLDMADITLEQFGALALGYTESMGNPHLREIIADSHPNVAAESVMVLGTPVEGIYLAARALLQPDDEVVVLSPAYDALVNMFEHVVGDGNVKLWEFEATPAGWQLNLDDLRQLLTNKTRLIVVNFPHNPTGFLPSPSWQRALADLVDAEDIWLFYDEMYYGLVHSGTEPIPSMADVTQKAIVLSGLSKTYGLPGLRSGWLIVQDQVLRERLTNWKFYTSICAPAPTEFLAIVALRVREQLRERSIAQIEANLALADAFFARWPQLFTWRRPQAGSTALVAINVPSAEAYAAQLAEEAGVLIHPTKTMGTDDHHVRFGFGRAGFGEALAKFEAYLEQNS